MWDMTGDALLLVELWITAFDFQLITQSLSDEEENNFLITTCGIIGNLISCSTSITLQSQIRKEFFIF